MTSAAPIRPESPRRGERPGAAAAKARDAVSGLSDPIAGNFRFVRGVSGAGLKLDGYTTAVVRAAADAPRPSGAFSIEAWIALAAYPWNLCPIAAQKAGDAGFAFSVGPRGELSFGASDEGEWLRCDSGPILPLRTWVPVAAVYDPGTGIRIYADGRLVGSVTRPSRFKPASAADLVLGTVTRPDRPSHAVGSGEGTLPSWFSLDAVLDELKLFSGALSEDAIRAAAAATAAPREPPPLPPRRESMIMAFRKRLAEHRGEVTAEAIAAAPLNDEQTKRLRGEIERVVGKAVNLNVKVDRDLLGGMIVKGGSKMIDSSLKTKLNRLKSVMKEA